MYCCGTDECLFTAKTKTGFKRHYDPEHLRKKVDCTFAGCPRVGKDGFTRRDNMTAHLRETHNESIPKETVRFDGLGSVRRVLSKDSSQANQ